MSTLALWRDRLSYQPISLGVVALLTSAALVFANQATQAKIVEAEQRDLQASLAEVLPAGFADNDLLKDKIVIEGGKGDGGGDGAGQPVTVYVARQAGRYTGAVFQTSARGYAGEIVVLMGVDADGKTLGVRVIRHKETPGLGDKVDLAKSNWVHGFEGKSLAAPPPEQWAVKKDGGQFDQFAGATITPRAVVKAVKSGLAFYAAHRGEISEGKSDGQ